MPGWDHEVDLLAVGSGAASMSGALRAHDLGLSALICERSERYGGSTAMSGGVCWIPNNPQMAQRGIPDDREAALRYLDEITQGEVERDRLEAYVDGSLRMLEWFEERTHVRFDALEHYTDYYAEAPGGRPGGRSMDSSAFDGRQLGEALRQARMPHPQALVMGRMSITPREAHTILRNDLRGRLLLMWRLLTYALRRGKRRYARDPRMTAGNALVGRLRRSLLDRDVPLWLQCPVRELIVEGSRVVGAAVEREGSLQRIRAHHGVLLGAGGFEKNAEIRRRYQQHPIGADWAAGHEGNLGDGLRMGMELGAEVALLEHAWWTPVTLVPREKHAWVLVVEKSLPGSIFVNARGERFVNEAEPYVDVVVDMYAADDGQGLAVPCWMIFDATFRQRYPVGPVAPGYAAPDSRISRRLREGFLRRADTLAELAERIGVSAEGLQRTVARFNPMAVAGVDEDFGRGEQLSDRYYSDHRVEPNPCLAPIERPPYYAIPVYPGDLGTKGGLLTDAGARVLRPDGRPIEGLYAAGNTAASIMGRTYPGAGGTIGPALCFGMIAAESALADVQRG